MQKKGYVYILASKPYGTLYIGVTSDLKKRVWQHRERAVEGFTKAHNIKMLVYYEIAEDMTAAITREKTLKGWRRDWKIEAIEKDNPNWDDLYPQL